MADLFSVSINYLLFNKVKITKEEVSEFLKANPIVEENGKQVIKRTKISTLKDHILLNIFRSGLLFSREEKRSSMNILIDHYYLKHLQPEIYNSNECFAKSISKI